MRPQYSILLCITLIQWGIAAITPTPGQACQLHTRSLWEEPATPLSQAAGHYIPPCRGTPGRLQGGGTR